MSILIYYNYELVRIQSQIFILYSTLKYSSVILGRAIKNEYLSLGVLTTTFGGAWLATRGGDKAGAKPVAGQSVQQIKESIPINASSRCVIFTHGLRVLIFFFIYIARKKHCAYCYSTISDLLSPTPYNSIKYFIAEAEKDDAKH